MYRELNLLKGPQASTPVAPLMQTGRVYRGFAWLVTAGIALLAALILPTEAQAQGTAQRWVPVSMARQNAYQSQNYNHQHRAAFPAPAPVARPTYHVSGADTGQMMMVCRDLARQRLVYRFGGSDPRSGGLDCSATVRWVLRQSGVGTVPRTSYEQYKWVAQKGLVGRTPGSASASLPNLRPGFLLFWGGTYSSKNPVTHVMIYAGYDKATRTHYVFGAKGKTKKGVNGAGVDFFPLKLDLGSKTRFVGYAPVPGHRYW